MPSQSKSPFCFDVILAETSKSETTCESEPLSMSCPIGSYIQVYDAFFGRLSSDVCPVDEEEVTQTQRIDCLTTGIFLECFIIAQ